MVASYSIIKDNMKRLLCSFAAIIASVAMLLAQDTLRIGYIDFQSSLEQMDEYTAATTQLEQLSKNYADEYARMETEYNDKVKDYILNGKTLSEPIKLARQAEITECEDRMDLFKKRYMSDLEKQRTSLLEPIRKKLSTIIKQAADEKKVTLVIDGQTPLYITAPCIDLTDDVKNLLKQK